MVIKETMRLYPAVWGIGRRALQDCELGGYRVPAGSNIFLLQWRTQRDPRFFPDPERSTPNAGGKTLFARGKFRVSRISRLVAGHARALALPLR